MNPYLCDPVVEGQAAVSSKGPSLSGSCRDSDNVARQDQQSQNESHEYVEALRARSRESILEWGGCIDRIIEVSNREQHRDEGDQAQDGVVEVAPDDAFWQHGRGIFDFLRYVNSCIGACTRHQLLQVVQRVVFQGTQTHQVDSRVC